MANKKTSRKTRRDRDGTPVKIGAEAKGDSKYYKAVLSGPLKDAVDHVYEMMQRSRKFRRLASAPNQHLIKEAVDRGLQQIEQELEEELADMERLSP
jgi:hypothetical protein